MGPSEEVILHCTPQLLALLDSAAWAQALQIGKLAILLLLPAARLMAIGMNQQHLRYPTASLDQQHLYYSAAVAPQQVVTLHFWSPA